MVVGARHHDLVALLEQQGAQAQAHIQREGFFVEMERLVLSAGILTTMARINHDNPQSRRRRRGNTGGVEHRSKKFFGINMGKIKCAAAGDHRIAKDNVDAVQLHIAFIGLDLDPHLGALKTQAVTVHGPRSLEPISGKKHPGVGVSDTRDGNIGGIECRGHSARPSDTTPEGQSHECGQRRTSKKTTSVKGHARHPIRLFPGFRHHRHRSRCHR